MASLAPSHLEDLRKSGLTDKTIVEAGIESVPPADIKRKLGFSGKDIDSMYEIPYLHLQDGERFSRYRVFYVDGRRGPKYLQQKDTSAHLYIPPGIEKSLMDPSVPLLITEGEKKSLKAVQEGLVCIALPGLWCWSDGQKQLISDFDQIALEGRKIYLVPDSDWLHPNKHGYRKNLRQAVYELAGKLKERGAEVFIVLLPQDSGMKVGLDDYLVEHSIDEFQRLPVVKALSLFEQIAEATPENYKEILLQIAGVKDEIQKEVLCKALSKKLGVPCKAVRNGVKTYEKYEEPITTSNNIIIAHPSYEITKDFLSLGFRETVVIGNQPKDKNFYLIATPGGYMLHDDKILRYIGKNIIFDERNRCLLRIEDKWHKDDILSFIKQPVSPTGLYQEIKQVLKQYIEFQKEEIYGLVSAWIIATYFFLIFHAFPFLFIFGKKQTGKSRLLDLLERLCFGAMKIKGISVPSLADSVDGVRGVFLADQVETLGDSRNLNMELIGLISDSYTCGGGKRRIVDISNKQRRVVEFDTYSPKAFASSREIDADLKDRCIQITMLRAKGDFPFPEPYLPIWHEVRNKLYRLLLTKWRKVKEIYQIAGGGVSQRIRELWRPVETILILENVPEEEVHGIKQFFLESMQETQSELSESEIELFEILLKMLEVTGECILTIEDIAHEMRTRPKEGITDKGLQTWVGRTLRVFQLYDAQAGRKNNKRAYHFTYDHVKNIFDRYYLTGGIGGKVANLLNLKGKNGATYQNRGGTEVAEVASEDATCHLLPPTKIEVAGSNILKNKDKCHLPPQPPVLGDKYINIDTEVEP